MFCEFIILSETINGKMLKCSQCEDKVALMYNNITQSFYLEDFYQLKNFIDKLDVEDYFIRYPKEEKIYIRTEVKTLFFSFAKEELYELRSLMANADLKIQLNENVKKNLN